MNKMKCDRCHRKFKPDIWFTKDVIKEIIPDKCRCYNFGQKPHKPRLLCKENLQYCINENCCELEHECTGCGYSYKIILKKGYLCKECNRKNKQNLKIYWWIYN